MKNPSPPDLNRPTNDLLATRAAAEFLGCTFATLNTWRCTGAVKIPFVKIGSLVRYRRQDLERFLNTNSREG